MTKPKRYATGTEVPVEKSRIELEQLLQKHGATQRSIATDDAQGRTVITFQISGRFARLDMKVDTSALPDPTKHNWHQKTECPQGWGSWTTKRRTEWVTAKRDQSNRELMRRLLLVLKAKLELVANGDTTFEREFLSDLLLPNGETVHEAIKGRLAEAYDTGSLPPLLPEYKP